MEHRFQLGNVTNRESPLHCHQIDGLLEALILWSKDHRATESDRFLDIVDIHTKSSTNIDETCILIELGKDADGVDH